MNKVTKFVKSELNALQLDHVKHLVQLGLAKLVDEVEKKVEEKPATKGEKK